MKKITRALEDYLEYILIIEEEGKEVRTNELAQRMGVSPPSVVEAIRRLERNGLVSHESYGAISLTPRGKEIARKVYDKHKILVGFLKELLLLDDQKAEREGCTIEHMLSSETVKKLKILKEFIESLPENSKEKLRELLQKTSK